MKSSDNALPTMAIGYAKLGYMVFPCHAVRGDGSCSCRLGTECPKSNVAKHPRTRNGRKDATTDLAKIDAWWTKWPDANVAIATGRTSGVFVLDVDGRNGGNYALERLEDLYRRVLKGGFDSVSATQTSITGSGGKHFIFRYPRDFSLPGGSNLIGSGLDICSDGQHIIAPPSLHRSGNRYHWHGDNVAPIEAPDWLIYEILQSSHSAERDDSIGSNAHYPLAKGQAVIWSGERNKKLFQHACGLVNSYSEAEVRRRIQGINLSRCNPPLEDLEVNKILKSAEKYR